MDITAIRRNVARNSLRRYGTTGGQRCIKLVILWGFSGHTAQHEGSYLVPGPEIEPVPSAAEAQSPSHCTSREVPSYFGFNNIINSF